MTEKENIAAKQEAELLSIIQNSGNPKELISYLFSAAADLQRKGAQVQSI